jgi:Sec-independent protein secretion pathway component TatC
MCEGSYFDEPSKGATFVLVVLGAIRYQAEKAMMSKLALSIPLLLLYKLSTPVSRFLLCLSSCPEFLK